MSSGKRRIRIGTDFGMKSAVNQNDPLAADTDTERRCDPLDDFPPKQSVPYLVTVLSRLFQADYLSRIAKTKIAPAQAFVLRELWQEEPLSQVELSRRLDIGKATVGQTLTRLQRSGLVERRRVSSDRRLMMIGLTQKGRDLREPLAAAARAQVEALRTRLGADSVEQLTELLILATASLRRPHLVAKTE